ncbi:hypothetical protein HY571_00025 [Candidatus Micrarchaeota archaeon]|nr:hypothetical protein [Candidatus Micrarchaeota archaeon]
METPLVQQVKELKGKNSELLGLLRQLFDKADQEKKTRDAENAAVKQLVTNIAKTRSELKQADQALSNLQKTLPRQRSPDSVKKEIASLEYNLQLNYSPSREKTTGKRIKELTNQLRTLAANAPKFEEFSRLRKQFAELKAQLKAMLSELKQRTAQSESHHQAMLEALKKADKLQSSLSLGELEEKRGLLANMNKEERLRQRSESIENRKETRRKITSKLREVRQKAQEIMEKFKKGETISFEELQVLQAAGMEI